MWRDRRRNDRNGERTSIHLPFARASTTRFVLSELKSSIVFRSAPLARLLSHQCITGFLHLRRHTQALQRIYEEPWLLTSHPQHKEAPFYRQWYPFRSLKLHETPGLSPTSLSLFLFWGKVSVGESCARYIDITGIDLGMFSTKSWSMYIHEY